MPSIHRRTEGCFKTRVVENVQSTWITYRHIRSHFTYRRQRSETSHSVFWSVHHNKSCNLMIMMLFFVLLNCPCIRHTLINLWSHPTMISEQTTPCCLIDLVSEIDTLKWKYGSIILWSYWLVYVLRLLMNWFDDLLELFIQLYSG